MLSKAELFARLAEGHAARLTVVTPNKRLSQALMLEFDAFQIKNNLSVWEAPDILPFGAFVARLYEDGLYSDLSAELPMLLTPAQEEEIWKQVVAGSDILEGGGNAAATAAKCRDAWNLANLWRVRPGAGNLDTESFAQWLTHYKKKTEGEVDAARLPDLLVKFLPELKRPKGVVAYAFDILPPQTKEFLDALGVEISFARPDAKAGAVSRTSFDSAKHELESAAQWARARLESGATRIGVVVPDIQRRRSEVVRVFSRVMGQGAKPFDISIGVPLERVPVVALALSVLRISQEEIPFEEASRIVRSPFIGGAESELGARMRLETRLRDKLDATVALPKLIAASERAPLLRKLLEKLFALRETGLFSQKTPAEWARHFSTVLAAAGFPGERATDSDEFQALAKWHEALGELSKLDRVAREMDFSGAFQVLRKLCADTLFQPESPDTPIQVLGLLESAGVEFDHLWVTGLTDDAWPLKSSPNPFLPLALQRKAGIPEASAETSLALDRRITEGWKQAAAEVIFSFYVKEQDREVSPSPLIADIPLAKVEVPAYPKLRDLIFAGRKQETIQDRVAPAVRAKQIRGGTRVLSDQAACPFRAFARWRLAAEALEEPAEGLDAAKRGHLVHELMKNLWTTLKDSSSLQKDFSAAIDDAAAAAVKELEIEGRFAELERTRLARLAREWLEVEKARPAFAVTRIEDKTTIGFAGLEFTARIDRMDKLESGGHALIDYKTSRNPSPKHWEPPRPDDPQLALYAVSAKEEVTAVVFAKIRPGEMRMMGYSRDDKALPKVQKAKAWQPLLQSWKTEAESLGTSFAKGEAGVDPKKDLMSCRYCGLETLCRVYEKINVLAEEETEEW
ncbi:MAG: ATP-dependent helicase/nuclease subunit [Betaproteobacteria bacterium]|jgi:probable DNA repair protein|nr:ATP-dependent helicase/nuclease subunit [Betaproteobacteria bacterium]